MNGTLLEGAERPKPARAEAVHEQRDESPCGKALCPLTMASGQLAALRVQTAASMQEDDCRGAWRLVTRRRQKHLPSQRSVRTGPLHRCLVRGGRCGCKPTRSRGTRQQTDSNHEQGKQFHHGWYTQLHRMLARCQTSFHDIQALMRKGLHDTHDVWRQPSGWHMPHSSGATILQPLLVTASLALGRRRTPPAFPL